RLILVAIPRPDHAAGEKLAVLLSLDAVHRAFGGVRAVDGASFSVGQGEIHGLIGPNGAGKTTLLNLVSGFLRPNSGSIKLADRRLDALPTYKIAAWGIGRTYQNIRLFPALGAMENVLVGEHLVRDAPLWKRLLFMRAARAEERSARGKALALLERVGLLARASARARDLSYG